MLIVGVDPGLTGALAMLDRNGLIQLADMPAMLKGKGAGRVKNEINAAGLNELFRAWIEGRADEILIVMEQVASMPGQGVASMFSMGDSRGCIRGVIAARGYPLEWVTPRSWKQRYGLNSDKEQARAKAIQLYPTADLARKRDHNRAEAILIAGYGYERFA